MDTIFALASAPGKAGVAVVRISGPDALAVGTAMAGALPPARGSALRTLRAANNDVLDQALVLTFAQNASFTGEPIVEFHLHGSTAVIGAVCGELGQFNGLRLAEAGEFTRRALENGRIDLAQVEGLADLIEAETEAQRRQALRVLSGEIGNHTERWRRLLIRAAALVEATIDFADEDVPVDVTPEVLSLLRGVKSDLEFHLAGSNAAERIRVGFEVAIIGAPNVGKSTLLNALAGRDAAITSEYAGTTRDVIEVRMDIGGLPVTLLDTAGIRDTTDYVESIGIERAKKRAFEADIRVFLVDGSGEPVFPPMAGDIVLRSKADLLSDKTGAVSGLSGHGLDQLVEALRSKLLDKSASASIASRLRHRLAIEKALSFLLKAESLLLGSDAADFVAEELRSATRSLDQLVGRVDVENLLDEIFSSFCIGK
jgi:tRNA modification GTPase